MARYAGHLCNMSGKPGVTKREELEQLPSATIDTAVFRSEQGLIFLCTSALINSSLETCINNGKYTRQEYRSVGG